MQSPGKVVSREDLSQEVLGRAFDPFDRSLDMHVSRLRRKLSSSAAEESLVKTIRGVGYQLVLDRDAVDRGLTDAQPVFQNLHYLLDRADADLSDLDGTDSCAQISKARFNARSGVLKPSRGGCRGPTVL